MMTFLQFFSSFMSRFNICPKQKMSFCFGSKKISAKKLVNATILLRRKRSLLRRASTASSSPLPAIVVPSFLARGKLKMRSPFFFVLKTHSTFFFVLKMHSTSLFLPTLIANFCTLSFWVRP